MYDLEGSDSDREWIELLNTGTDVDLTNWRFEEGVTQHTLTLKQGNAVVSNEQYAVIVDDYTQFLQDHPDFSGTVFDSSFSLSNTGENLKLRDTANGNIIDEINYSTALGAAGDNNSLQRKSDGSWIAAFPTPGSQNASDPPPTPSPTPPPTPTPSPTPTPIKTPSPTATLKKTATLTNTPTPTPKNTPISSSNKTENSPLPKNSNEINYRIASIAAVSTSATPEAKVAVKNQKQTNPFLWIGLIFIFAGTVSIGYIYLKKNGKIHFKLGR